jgi:hypothetical protein
MFSSVHVLKFARMGPHPAPRAPFVAAYLVKLHEDKRFMADLRTYLVEHPALVYLLGFPRQPDPSAPHGFDVAATVPDRRQRSRVLRTLPNAALAVPAHRDRRPPAGHAADGAAGHLR